MELDLETIKSGFEKVLFKFSWGTSARKDFYQLLGNFVADGVPLFEALQQIGKRWKEIGDPRAIVTQSIADDMRGKHGKSLTLGQAIGKFVPSTEAMAIDAGEQSGDIPGGLKMAMNLASVSTKIRGAIMGEIAYPAFLSVLFFVFLYGLKTSIIPVLAEILPRSRWPMSPRLLGELADNAPFLVIGIISVATAIAVSFTFSRSRWTGDVRYFFDRFVPPWSIQRQITGAIMMTCISALIKAGTPFSAVIAKLSTTAGDWEVSHLNEMRQRMREGVPDGEAMAGKLFDGDVRWEISVYAKLTGFADALESLSERVVSRVISRIQTLAAIVRNLVMFSIAGVIIWIYGAFFEITMAAKSAM